MQSAPSWNIREIYNGFSAPVTEEDCGLYCAAHNPSRKPFCCDICLAVPAAYHAEWNYLREHTALWHPWRGDECSTEQSDPRSLEEQTPLHMRLLACLGPEQCERDYRSISCRQFPFFPYITSDDRFIGLTYNWDFEDTCWVISHLDLVSPVFRQEFICTYDELLYEVPDDYDSYYYLSEDMRRHFAKIRRRIPLLHRDGGTYLISPKSEKLAKASFSQMRKFGPYA